MILNIPLYRSQHSIRVSFTGAEQNITALFFIIPVQEQPARAFRYIKY